MSRWPWLVAGVVYTLLAAATIRWTRLDGGVAMVWLANGFLVPWLSLNRQREWPRAIAACLAGNVIMTILMGAGWGGLGLPVLNLLECIVTVAILRRWLGHSYYLDSTTGVAKFALVVTLAPLVDSPIAALVAHNALGVPFGQTAFNWFVGHALGVIIIAPLASLLLRSFRAYNGPSFRRERAVVYAKWLTPVAAVTTLVFWQTSLPVFFLPLVPMMLATLRMGRSGAAWSVVIAGATATVATIYGFGPVALSGESPVVQLQFLQFYLAVTVVILLPVAVLMRERRALAERLSASENGLRLMAENSGDAMLHVNSAGRIIQATGAVEALLERDANSILGHYASELVLREDRRALIETHAKLMADPYSTVDLEYRVQMRGDGRSKWLESRARALLDADGRPVGTISAIRDIEARKRTETELHRAATTDQLTGIANRRAFFSRFDTRPTREGVLIVADLDYFKTINDRFGHHVGDAALRTYARTASSEMRQDDLIGRIGGEEFAFFLPGAQLDHGLGFCQRLQKALANASFKSDEGEEHQVTASMGMVLVLNTEDAATALKRADSALYAAKEAGRDCLRLAA